VTHRRIACVESAQRLVQRQEVLVARLGCQRYSSFAVCRDDLDGDRTDLQMVDLEEPVPGQVFIYLITAEAAGVEGTLGFATTAERSNFPGNVCP